MRCASSRSRECAVCWTAAGQAPQQATPAGAAGQRTLQQPRCAATPPACGPAPSLPAAPHPASTLPLAADRAAHPCPRCAAGSSAHPLPARNRPQSGGGAGASGQPKQPPGTSGHKNVACAGRAADARGRNRRPAAAAAAMPAGITAWPGHGKQRPTHGNAAAAARHSPSVPLPTPLPSASLLPPLLYLVWPQRCDLLLQPSVAVFM